MAQDQNIIQDAIDKDVASGRLIPITDAAQHRIDAQKSGRYDIYVEIDIDCEELVDACGLEYTRSAEDDTQNEICISLTKDEWLDFIAESEYNLVNCNEQQLGAYLLNYELSEYVTKVTIYKPSGDIISFY
tara:strand:- start:287 stop:679 length:393 start_codon:yes stop_codon:yes gene_type:complete